MGSWTDIRPPMRDYTSMSLDAMGMHLATLGQVGLGSFISGATGANVVKYIPIYLPTKVTVARLTWNNGGTVAGNVDCGIYTIDGTRIISTGNTLQATINVQQTVDVADTLVGPGDFFLAIVNSSTGTFFTTTMTAPYQRLAGLLEQVVGAGTGLPATATFAAASTNALVPLFGFSARA